MQSGVRVNQIGRRNSILCYGQHLLESSGDVISIISKMGPILNPRFCVRIHPFAHSSHRKLRQWGQVSETFACNFEGHVWEWIDQPFNFSCLESYTIAFSMVSLPELALSIHQTSDGVIVLTSKSDVTPYSVFFNGQTNLHGISGPSWSGPVYS